jgi:ribonuclease-3
MGEYRSQLREYLKRDLGVKPRRIEIYEQAFLHRSYIHEQNMDTHTSNERLELLGDSVLGLAITASLLNRYPSADEGDLSKMKAQLGSRQTLGEVSRRLGLSAFLRVGRGEEMSRSNSLPSLIGNAYEALVGAVFLDLGYEEGARFVIRCLEPEFAKDLIAQDYKSVLQEYTQRRFHAPPFYQVLRTYGPEHRKTFEVAMKLSGRVYGRGRGQTKKDAEQDAARLTLRRMGYQPGEAIQPVLAPMGQPKHRWYWPFGRKQERLI